uniref:CUB domain-containing protein n=1 Tax=Neogobius melanostomus TaxID=47308 RepID=A0A8C6U4F9_9GOBI
FFAPLAACGGHIQLHDGDDPGYVTSPGYPQNYPQNIDCVWVISVPNGEALTFTYFNLEPHSTCGWDSVTIFNGGSAGSPVIGQYCGSTSPGTVQSGSNKLTVQRQRSDGAGGPLLKASVCPAGCGGVIHADSGIIKSPNYPQNFPANSECLWHIIAHQGNHLEFNRFDLEASSSCRYDYVAVYDGPNTLAPLLGTFCGSELPPHLKSSTRSLSCWKVNLRPSLNSLADSSRFPPKCPCIWLYPSSQLFLQSSQSPLRKSSPIA